MGADFPRNAGRCLRHRLALDFRMDSSTCTRHDALMYQKIKKHPTPRKIYADKLEQEKVATLEDATEQVNLYRDALDALRSGKAIQ